MPHQPLDRPRGAALEGVDRDAAPGAARGVVQPRGPSPGAQAHPAQPLHGALVVAALVAVAEDFDVVRGGHDPLGSFPVVVPEDAVGGAALHGGLEGELEWELDVEDHDAAGGEQEVVAGGGGEGVGDGGGEGLDGGRGGGGGGGGGEGEERGVGEGRRGGCGGGVRRGGEERA